MSGLVPRHGIEMSLHHSLTRAGFPIDLSHYFGYVSDFGPLGMGEDDGTGIRTWREYLRDWYTDHTISRAHMEYLLEVINYIKYNLAKYQMYRQIGRNRSYSYRHILSGENEYDSDFLQELNSIARKMTYADDPLPLINYTGDVFLIDTRRQPLETRYSDEDFRMMTKNIRQHLADEPGYLLQSQQINQREASLLEEKLQSYPFWRFGELYHITSLNYPKAFK
jgi:hypothetical protein